MKTLSFWLFITGLLGFITYATLYFTGALFPTSRPLMIEEEVHAIGGLCFILPLFYISAVAKKISN